MSSYCFVLCVIIIYYEYLMLFLLSAYIKKFKEYSNISILLSKQCV